MKKTISVRLQPLMWTYDKEVEYIGRIRNYHNYIYQSGADDCTHVRYTEGNMCRLNRWIPSYTLNYIQGKINEHHFYAFVIFDMIICTVYLSSIQNLSCGNFNRISYNTFDNNIIENNFTLKKQIRHTNYDKCMLSVHIVQQGIKGSWSSHSL